MKQLLSLICLDFYQIYQKTMQYGFKFGFKLRIKFAKVFKSNNKGPLTALSCIFNMKKCTVLFYELFEKN